MKLVAAVVSRLGQSNTTTNYRKFVAFGSDGLLADQML